MRRPHLIILGKKNHAAGRQVCQRSALVLSLCDYVPVADYLEIGRRR